MSAYRLRKLEICGFRGIGQKQSIDFGLPVTLIHGNNRQGKSSIINAIEWCLFGPEVAAIKYGDIRERDGWEVKHLSSKVCYVKCEFVDDSGKTLIAQRTFKSAKTTEFQYEIPDFEKGTDDKQLLAMLQISPSDFLASVHLHPEVIRSLIVAKPKERKEAIDRLLGLSGSRDIVDALNAAKPDGP